MTVAWLILGLLLGIAFIAIARAFGERRIFSVGLFVVAADYIGLAAYGNAGFEWMAIEVLGMVIYGTFGFLGVRGSTWWLVVGWALHPVWDIGLHLVDSGSTFTPPGYALQCISFDLVVALYIAVQNRRRPTTRRDESIGTESIQCQPNRDIPSSNSASFYCLISKGAPQANLRVKT